MQGGEKYDLIFQLAGTFHPPSHYRRLLAPQGRLVLCGGNSDGRWIDGIGRVLQAVALSPFVSQTLGGMYTKGSQTNLQHLRKLLEGDRLTPVIDRTHPLSEVPEAIRYLEEGHARGKVVISV
jgi:NADPH:quinone reductase-like Zn-dependent oxidoreductase